MDNIQKTFFDVLIETANIQNDKIAIIENDGKLQTTYTELLSIARKIAYYINSKGIAEHSFIAVKLNDGRDYVAAEMGIWMTRCVPVPMGTTFPQQRIDYIMEHCESPLMIDDCVIAESQEMPEAEIKLPSIEDDAMLLYTSGSTGNPKGILHTFATIGKSFARRTDVVPRFTSDLQYGNYAPMYFVAKKGVYGVLLAGATVHFYSKELRTDMKKLSDYIAENGINRSYIPPAALQIFKNKAESLKYVVTGSEKLTTQYSKDGYVVINNYGMSETFASVALHKLPDHPMDNVPVGKIVEGLEYVIADEDGNPVAEGEIGEMCFKEHLCKEYYKDPEKTAELFRGGLMHTGDLVREVDGLIYYIQRKDWMVKINGQRVEPSEVEIVIRKIEGVKNAVVKGFDSEDGSQYIVGYYILEDGATLTSEEIRAELSNSVPPYMVPRFMVEMKVFPINLNGKIDRKSLQSPEDTVDGVSTNYVAPTNDIERQLCEAMAKLLGNKLLGIEDDFLSLGADSIRIMKLQQMCPDLGLSSRLIHTYRTPKAIASQLAESEGGAEASHVDVHEPQPLTQTQLGIYVECEQHQGKAIYNNPSLLRLDDDIDIQKFAVAVEIAIAAHPGVSATIMEAEDGTPMFYMPEQPWQQPVCTIEEVSENELELIKRDLMQPFDLKSDRLYRARIFKTPSAKYVFFDFHHIIFDGTSMHIFLNDVSKAYAGNSVSEEVYTAYDVAYDEQQERNTDALQRAKTWYANTFGELLEPTFPTADKDDKNLALGHYIHEISMTPEQLDAWCADHGVTANVLATTTFGKVLATYTNSDNAIFATIYNGRSDLRTARTMGMLVKTFPVSVNIGKETTVQALLNTTKQQMMGAMANDIYSFAELASDTGMTSDVMFVYQGDMHRVRTDKGLNFRGEHLDFNATGERFNVQMLSTPENTLILDIQYHANSYSKDFITRFAKAYNTALKEMTIREKVVNVQLVNEEEAATIIAMSYGGDLSYKAEETLVDKVICQAHEQPDAIAVVDCKSRYTYKELDGVSNTIAQRLIYEGVQPNEFVCIMLPRCKEFVASVLGVMKAGAAYVPVDMEYPEDRRQYMQDDCEAKVVITEEWLSNNDTLRYENEGVNLSKPSGRAYMIYTSGSTGKPKGVVIHHNAITACAAWQLPEFDLKLGKKNLHHPSFSFDASTFDLFYPLIAGAEIHILDENQRKDMDFIAAYIKENAITGMTMSTALGMALLNQYNLDIEYIMLGGEKFLPVKKTDTRLYNGYGPTEFTVCSSFHIINQDKDVDIPIGRAVPNTYSFICDKSGNLLPQGVMGELCLAGPQIAECYWHREELTTEKFCAIPFAGSNPSLKRMYRTGDLARYNAEGELEFCGRIDNQVKLRGFRIEMGEIENAAKAFAGIMDVAAEVRKINGQDMLCLYYTAETEIDKAQLSSSLSSSLTDYMVPNVFVQMKAMPLTPNGKVNRKALPLPEMEVAALENVAPATTRETTLLNIAHELLGRDDFGVTDGLKELGMSSLTAIKLAAKAKQEGIVLKVGDIMHHNTIRSISQAMMSVVSWFAPYEKGKPIFVLTSGIFTREHNQRRMEILSKHYNILFIEPLDEHYNYLFLGGESFDDVAAFYYELIDTYATSNPEVDSEIIGFGGFCMGGFVSYRLALLHEQNTGKKAKVILGDTVSSYVGAVPMTTEKDYEESYANTMKILEMIMQGTRKPGQDEEAYREELKGLTRLMVTKFDVASHVVAGVAISASDLDVLLFNTYQGRDINVFPDAWRSLVKNLKTIDIDVNHFTFCMNLGDAWAENFCEAVIEFIQRP